MGVGGSDSWDDCCINVGGCHFSVILNRDNEKARWLFCWFKVIAKALDNFKFLNFNLYLFGS